MDRVVLFFGIMIDHLLKKEIALYPELSPSFVIYQVLNGGEPGGAFTIKSTSGMT